MLKERQMNESVINRFLTRYNGPIINSQSTEYAIQPVLGMDHKIIIDKMNEMDWAFAEDDTTYLAHDIHPYPAKFAPQLPAQLIRLFSEVGETIWDPFGGSGTTALEALLSDRSCISTDINPIGSIIGKAKTTALYHSDEEEINRFITHLIYYSEHTKCIVEYFAANHAALEKEIPDIPNIEKWFQENVICELAFIKHLIKKELCSNSTTAIALASLSKIITRVSNQENETTYRSVVKKLDVGDTLSIYIKDLSANFEKLKNLSTLLGYRTVQFITENVMEQVVGDNKTIKENSIDFIVTSPPYPNAFDYHLYHRFRIFWLDSDPREMAKAEIGSHLNYQREKKTFEQFEIEMKPVLENCFLALRAGRYAVFILGDALFDGIEYPTAQRIALLAEQLGFKIVGIVDRPLPVNKRSMKSWARRATSEQILVLQKPDQFLDVSLFPVQYRLWDYEQIISDLERTAITGGNNDHFTVSSTFDSRKLKKLTFYSAYKYNGTQFDTWQKTLECGETVDLLTRKDPKYLTHGIHPYKGKFYPQLVRPLLNILKIPPKGFVFDPFCGSGTVALEAVINGFNAFGCDINPTAVEIATAKTAILTVSPYDFERQVAFFKQEIVSNPGKKTTYEFPYDSLSEIESWFPHKVIAKMGIILSKIQNVPDDRIRCFLKVVLSSMIRDISQQEPSDLRIRRRKEPILDAPVIEMYLEKLDKQYQNIMGFFKIRNKAPETIGKAEIWRGNSNRVDDLKKMLPEDGVDIVITSPPYATALPYIDTNRLNMLVIDGLNAHKREPIEAEMTGTREINKKTRELYENKIINNDYGSITASTAKEIIKKLYVQNRNADVGFRKQNMAALIYMYFRDMTETMSSINQVLKAQGYVCMVIGDTKTTTGIEQVIIKTTQVLREIGSGLGWDIIYDIPISVTKEKYLHMNNSITENNILVFQKK